MGEGGEVVDWFLGGGGGGGDGGYPAYGTGDYAGFEGVVGELVVLEVGFVEHCGCDRWVIREDSELY